MKFEKIVILRKNWITFQKISCPEGTIIYLSTSDKQQCVFFFEKLLRVELLIKVKVLFTMETLKTNWQAVNFVL